MQTRGNRNINASCIQEARSVNLGLISLSSHTNDIFCFCADAQRKRV